MIRTKLDDRQMVLRCLKGIDEATRVGAHRRDLWERCWNANDTPAYFGDVLRANGHFWLDPGAEQQYLANLRAELFEKYLPGIDTVHEFGCGSGQNLKALVGKKQIVGYDWSKSATERVRSLGGRGVVFDMLAPHDVEINGAALTVHALEQLGDQWRPFFHFLAKKRPAVCIHIEPIEELYDPDDLLDHLALAYHRKRGYLSGYLTHLRALAAIGEIEILEQRRTYVGGLYHEAYSVIVWRVV